MQYFQILLNADSAECVSWIRNAVVITDPPYGVTSNIWDKSATDLVRDWLPANYGLVTTADLKYAAKIMNDCFSHDLVWVKTIGSGQLNINRRPLRLHEHILVFNGKRPWYNRIKDARGAPYSITRDITTEACYGAQQKHDAVNTGNRDRTTVLSVQNPRVRQGHPTQKPLALFKALVEMYSKHDDLIVDPFAGSGTILDVNRNVIAIEKEESYYELARSRRVSRVYSEELERIPYFRDYLPLIQNYRHTVFVSEGA